MLLCALRADVCLRVCFCVRSLLCVPRVQDSVGRLNFRAIVDGLGGVLFQYPFR